MHPSGIPTSVLSAIEASELENLIKLHIAKGKACSTLGRGENGAEALQNALDVSVANASIQFKLLYPYLTSLFMPFYHIIQILQHAPSANDEHFDRSVSFPIFSGLFVVLKMGAIVDDDECSYEKALIKQFVEQAR